MSAKQLGFAGILVMLCALPGISATLAVSASATPDAGLYDYSYQFAVTGAGAGVDTVFLGGNDLSPLNLVILVDSAPTANWTWLGNDTPQNYLEFFDTNGTALGNGDVLDVTFSSNLAPGGTHFAVGLNSSTGGATNTVTGVLAPDSAAAPEPGSLVLFFSGVAILPFARRYANRVRQ